MFELVFNKYLHNFSNRVQEKAQKNISGRLSEWKEHLKQAEFTAV